MDKNYQYFVGDEDREANLDSMRKYVVEKQELDKFLESIIRSQIEHRNLQVLDACCGIGHLSAHLSEWSPASSIRGVDSTAYLIGEAQRLFQNRPQLSFEVADVYTFAEQHPKAFDWSISWKTLSWLPHYREMVSALFTTTRERVIVSSLFYDGDIDFEVRVVEHQSERGQNDRPVFYNIYSFPRFREFVTRLGARRVDAYDFEISIDLPRPDPDRMGTYTEQLASGRRLQVSGAVVMTWKIVSIEL